MNRMCEPPEKSIYISYLYALSDVASAYPVPAMNRLHYTYRISHRLMAIKSLSLEGY